MAKDEKVSVLAQPTGRSELLEDGLLKVLRFELRVGGELEGLDPPGLQVPVPPDLGDSGEADPEFGGEQPRRPVRHTKLHGRLGQRRDHDLVVRDRPRPTRPVQIHQRRQATGLDPASPQQHRGTAHCDQFSDLSVAAPLRGQQHDPRPTCQTRPQRRGPHRTLQSGLIRLRDHQRCNANRHTPSLSRTNYRVISHPRH